MRKALSILFGCVVVLGGYGVVDAQALSPVGGELMAHLLANATGGASDCLTVFGLDNDATDFYDPGIDEFEPPAPPGDFVRTYFDHPEWGEIQDEFNSDIRSPFSDSCKDFPLIVHTNLMEPITLALGAIANAGCYSISLLHEGGATLVANFEGDSYVFTGNGGITNFIIRVCAGGGSCPFQGDMNADGFIDSTDLSFEIDVVYFGGLDPPDPECPLTRGDLNCDGFTDSVDLSLLLDFVFFGGVGPCDPCAR